MGWPERSSSGRAGAQPVPRAPGTARTRFDAVVVGSGPNGLAAAVVLGAAGLCVQVLEGGDTPGGGCRTEELTGPGAWHDVCSSVHPLAAVSSFFSAFGLARRDVRLLTPDLCFAHPLDHGRVGTVSRSVAETASRLGGDGPAYARLFGPLVEGGTALFDHVLSPLRSVPERPASFARFAALATRSARGIANRFEGDQARALFAGAAGHGMADLGRPMTAGVGLVLTGLAHLVGWPVVEGGSAAITDAMVKQITAQGGEVVTGAKVSSLNELEPTRAVLLDVTPASFVELASDRLPRGYARRLRRFSYGPGVCKVDWLLAGPVPWSAPECRCAVTLHLGGSFEEIAAAEAEVAAGRHPRAPFVVVVQAGVVDSSRAVAPTTTLWTYCHVPSGSPRDESEAIARQIERYAPGFRDLVLAKSVQSAHDEEEHNPNYVGGDIGGGAISLRQTLFRPTPRWNPYSTPIPGVYLCSSSTPPGPGVHGLCGQAAATSALAEIFASDTPHWPVR